ncbi:hypothetical protein PENTCL1PPCAC_16965, partial [Pristionchus entomophagus]
ISLISAMILFIVFTSVLLGLCRSAPAQSTFNNVCDGHSNYTDPQTGKITCYFFEMVAYSWQEAEQVCQYSGSGNPTVHYGAHLASIHDQAFNTFLVYLVTYLDFTASFYIGLYDTRAGYSWTDESVIDYNNFGPGNPNPNLGSCFTVKTYPNDSSRGKWFNSDCNQVHPYV